MIWGTFTPVHLLTLAAAAGMLVGLYFALRKADPRVQTRVLGGLSLLGIAAIVYNLLAGDNPWKYLPLHLCSVNAMILPAAVFTRNKTLGNLLLVWSLGALTALVLNYDMTNADLFSWKFFFYYFPHVVEFGIPILLFKLGLVKKDPRCVASTLGISMAVYTLVHFLNLAVIRYAGFQANYMFSIRPNNPLVELFYSLIPVRYWYMYLVLPIVVVYLLGVYAPQILRALRVRARTEKKDALCR